jgi:limonene-1,2-epoxide hydrolase
MTTNSELVMRFIAAWEARDLEAILTMMSPDAIYINVGLSEARGHGAIREGLAPFLGAARAVRWSVTHLAETAGGAVLTERVDVFEMGPKTLTIPVMGVFEFDGDLISAWRDYFDLPGFQAQMA